MAPGFLYLRSRTNDGSSEPQGTDGTSEPSTLTTESLYLMNASVFVAYFDGREEVVRKGRHFFLRLKYVECEYLSDASRVDGENALIDSNARVCCAGWLRE